MSLQRVLDEIPDAVARFRARLLVGLRHVDRDPEAHAEGMKGATMASDDLAEPLGRALGRRSVGTRGQEVVVSALGGLLHGFEAQPAGDPDRRMWSLPRLWPQIDVAKGIVLAIV